MLTALSSTKLAETQPIKNPRLLAIFLDSPKSFNRYVLIVGDVGGVASCQNPSSPAAMINRERSHGKAVHHHSICHESGVMDQSHSGVERHSSLQSMARVITRCRPLRFWSP
jgi:hypothetical protein